MLGSSPRIFCGHPRFYRSRSVAAIAFYLSGRQFNALPAEVSVPPTPDALASVSSIEES
jgi:hypothetical protein